MIEHIINILFRLMPISRFFYIKRKLLEFRGVLIGYNVSICGNFAIFGKGKLAIGDNCWISPNVNFFISKNTSIRIARNCDIGPCVNFYTGSHVIGKKIRRAGVDISKAISIGEGCWVGGGSTILPGVKIGRGSVVAAGSVVIKDVPSNSLVAGNPAVVKKYV
jgi:maltose O-acetyltransferase